MPGAPSCRPWLGAPTSRSASRATRGQTAVVGSDGGVRISMGMRRATIVSLVSRL